MVQAHTAYHQCSVGNRVLSQKSQPTIQPTLHRTNGVETPSATRYSTYAPLLETGGGLLIHPDLFVLIDFRLFC